MNLSDDPFEFKADWLIFASFYVFVHIFLLFSPTRPNSIAC